MGEEAGPEHGMGNEQGPRHELQHGREWPLQGNGRRTQRKVGRLLREQRPYMGVWKQEVQTLVLEHSTQLPQLLLISISPTIWQPPISRVHSRRCSQERNTVSHSREEASRCPPSRLELNFIETSGSRHYRPTPSSAYAIHLVY